MTRSVMIFVVSFALVSFTSQAPHAQTNMGGGTMSMNSQEQGYVDMGQANANQQVQQLNANSTPVPSTYRPSSGGSSGSAKGAQTMQLIAAGASVAAAGYLGTKCFAPTPEKWACPLFALSVAQVGMSLAGAAGAKKSAGDFATTSGGGGYGGGATATGPGINGTMGAGNGAGSSGTNSADPQQMALDGEYGKLVGEYNQLRGAMEKSGIQVSPDGKTITDTKTGKSYPASAFGNSNSIAGAMGLTDAEKAAMDDAMKAINAKANDKVKGIAMAVEGGAGGGGIQNASGGGSAGGSGYGGFNFRMPGQGGRKEPNVSGLTKQLGNDKIGIASDDIFRMIHIRYQERDKNGNFLQQ